MIHGELINLRAVERSDLGTLHLWLNDPEIMHFWGTPAATSSHSAIEEMIEGWLAGERRRQRPECLIAETLDGESIGLVILRQHEPDLPVLELSLLIGDPARWGQGLGGDMLGTVADVAFSQWAIHRLGVRVEEGNARALRLYESAGFVREGMLRETSFYDGAYRNQIVMGLLATDLRPERSEETS